MEQEKKHSLNRNQQIFADAFTETMMQKLTENSGEAPNPSVFSGMFRDIFPKPKKATLPANVIEAVRFYNHPDHQELIRNWLKPENRNAVDENGNSLLHHAVLAGRLSLVDFFVNKKKFQLELENNEGYSALAYSVREAKNASLDQREKVIACIEKLLQLGAKTVTSNPIAPQVCVSIAAYQGDLEVLQLLERYGADINNTDMMGMPPLWFAKHVKDQASTQEVINYLESKGCVSTPSL